MKFIFLLSLMSLTPQSILFAQEPFTYKPKDIPEGDLPKGLTAEEYIKKVYQERHYRIKVTFKVVDEQGLPVEGADINVGIDSLLHGDGYNNYKGKTNNHGLYTVESRGQGCSDVLVNKKGYYPSRPKVEWDGILNPGGEIMHKNGGFRPWNPTITVVLKKIGHPIPMRVWLSEGFTIPKIGEEFGFDLFENDWVKPHGKGNVPDLLIKFESLFHDENNFSTTMFLRFKNPEDGLIPINELSGLESLLKYPRKAPLEGYDTKEILMHRILSKSESHLSTEKNPPKGFFVRFRTIKNPKTGEIISAYYGKITKTACFTRNNHPIQISTTIYRNRKLLHKPGFSFSFYLNPNLNDRNLEYDQINNLAPDSPKGVRWAP